MMPLTYYNYDHNKILKKIYGESDMVRKKPIDEIKMQFLNEIKIVNNFEWLNFERYEITNQIKLNKIKILGLQLSDQVLKNPNDENDELKIKFSLSTKLMKLHLNNIIDIVVNFFDFYSIQIDWKHKKIIFFVDQNFYDKFKINISSTHNDIKYSLIDNFRKNFHLDIKYKVDVHPVGAPLAFWLKYDNQSNLYVLYRDLKLFLEIKK